MELVQRYIAAVKRELPENKREDIGRELNANILDQLDALAEEKGTLTDADVAVLLKQMGHPRRVARQFVPPRPLIRLDYMPLYQYTLYMVLGILFLLQIVERTDVWISSSDMGLVRYLTGLAGGFLDDAIFGFASVTLVFWALSRHHLSISADRESDWQPERLPGVGPGWQFIPLQDIFTDLATCLFLLVVIWYPVWMPAEQLESSRFMLSDHAHLYLKRVSPLILLSVVFSLVQLRQRIWSRLLLTANVLLSLAFVIAIAGLAVSGPVLQFDSTRWQGVFDLYQLERSALITLIIFSMFPLWEAGRDLLRLRKFQ